MDRSAWVDNSAAVPALASVEVWMMGRSMVVVGVCLDVYMRICIYTHNGDPTPCQGPPTEMGQVSTERGVRDGQRDEGGGAG